MTDEKPPIEPCVLAHCTCAECSADWACVRPLVMEQSDLECPRCGEMAGKDNGPLWPSREMEREREELTQDYEKAVLEIGRLQDIQATLRKQAERKDYAIRMMLEAVGEEAFNPHELLKIRSALT
jgi:hypothetical protein